MFIIDSLVWLVNTIFFILYIVLVIRIIISWVSADPYNEIVQVIYSISEPILAPFRRLPLQFGAIDFSPLLAFFVLRILNSFAIWILYNLRVFIARGF
jgi:YggT family protein